MNRWIIEFDVDAHRSLKKLDPQAARRIAKTLNDLCDLEDPTKRCKALSGPLTGLWRLRIGDYRVILDIHFGKLVIVALDLGHRSDVYQ